MCALPLLSFLFLTLPAFAAPERNPPAAGTYQFQGNFSVSMKMHFEVVYAFTDEGAAKLTRLKKEGYLCEFKSRDTYLCKQFQGTEGAAEAVKSRVDNVFANAALTLGEPRGEPSLISKGDEVAEYSVPQTATYGTKTFDDYRLVMTGRFWSVRLGNPTEIQFSLSEAGELAATKEIFVTESKTAYSAYMVFASFLRM